MCNIHLFGVGFFSRQFCRCTGVSVIITRNISSIAFQSLLPLRTNISSTQSCMSMYLYCVFVIFIFYIPYIGCPTRLYFIFIYPKFFFNLFGFSHPNFIVNFVRVLTDTVLLSPKHCLML